MGSAENVGNVVVCCWNGEADKPAAVRSDERFMNVPGVAGLTGSSRIWFICLLLGAAGGPIEPESTPFVTCLPSGSVIAKSTGLGVLMLPCEPFSSVDVFGVVVVVDRLSPCFW